MFKINFSANKARKSLCVQRAAVQHEWLGFGEGDFHPELSPSMTRVPVLTQ